MNIQTDPILRRSILKYGRYSMALPFLWSHVNHNQPLVANSKASTKKTPIRLLWMTPGHGHMEDHFYPKEAGDLKRIGLPSGLAPLKKHLQKFTMIGQLSNNKNRQPHDGSEALLTCADVLGFPGKPRHNSVSCDTLAAMHLGQHTRYSSITLNNSENNNGHGGVAISYKMDGHPITGYHNPLEVYRLIFGGGISQSEQLHLLNKKKSILDIMQVSAIHNKAYLSQNDRQKLEEYFHSVRDIELSLQHEKKWVHTPKPKADFEAPSATLYGEDEIKFMFKMMMTSFQTDSTRVITYRMPDKALLKSIGISEVPHTLSHYGRLERLHDLNFQRTTKWAELISYLIDLMKTTPDPLDPEQGSIYDNTIAYFGGGLRTAHQNKNVPVILFGGGIKNLKHGRHRIAKKENTPLANLWLRMLKEAGVPVQTFADSTGTLDDLLT